MWSSDCEGAAHSRSHCFGLSRVGLRESRRHRSAISVEIKVMAGDHVSRSAGEGEGRAVTHWIGALKRGEPQPAQTLWERYFDKLARMAAARLRGPPGSPAVDGD